MTIGFTLKAGAREGVLCRGGGGGGGGGGGESISVYKYNAK